MRKIRMVLGEMFNLLKAHKLWVLAPVLITIAVLSILVFYVGPTVIITFIYAGV